jgi:hypothetical protein
MTILVTVFEQTAHSSGLARVVVKDIDGGADYFARWSNSFPTDPHFFPIAVWAENLEGTHSADKYKALGVNTFTNIWNGPTADQLAQLQAHGMYAIGGLDSQENNVAGHMYGDELDIFAAPCASYPPWLSPHCRNKSPLFGSPYTAPESVLAMSNAIRAKDPTRPVYMQYAKTLAVDGWGFWYLNDNDKRTYALAADILSFDYYVITDPWKPGKVWDIYDSTRLNRRYAGESKPVWPFIELSRIFEQSHIGATPAQVNAEVWNAIIGGARGIQYFNHNFFCQVIPGEAGAQGCTEHLLTSPEYAVMTQMVKSINEKILDLAPIINAPFAENYVSTNHGPNMSTMVKRFNGLNYVFAIPHAAGSRKVVFRLADALSGSVEVLYENRTLILQNGQFTDDFADENTAHFYKVSFLN